MTDTTQRDAPEPSSPERPSRVPEPRWIAVGIAAPLICLGLVLAIRLWLKSGGHFPGDDRVLHHMLYGQQSIPLLNVSQFMQAAGTPLVALITTLWALVFVWRADGPWGVAFVVLAGIGVEFNAFLKELSGTTPVMQKYSPGTLNFPSGHTVYATTVFGALAWIAWCHRRYLILAALLFVIALMGPFRVIGESHFVSDVAAGYLVGLAWLMPAAILTGHTGHTQGRASRRRRRQYPDPLRDLPR